MQPLHLENVKIASKFTVRNVNSCIVSNVSSCTGGNVSNVKRNFKKITTVSCTSITSILLKCILFLVLVAKYLPW